MKTQHILIGLAFILALNRQFPTAHAQGTAFTYQGRLNSGGAPANGIYDLAFTLYATNASGVSVAGPVTNGAVGVTNGLFTTLVDFGNVFTGASNWLEIAVQKGGSGFTTLSPRQPLTPTPYALYTPTAGVAASASSVAAANITGALGLDQLPAVVVTNGASGVTFSGILARGGPPGPSGVNSNGYAFSGNGGDNDSGMFSSADGQIEFYNNAIEAMRISNGRVGIGTTSPDRPLAIQGVGENGEWMSLIDTNGVTRWHLNNLGGGLNFVQTDVADGRLYLGTNGNVGIGTLNPLSALAVNGTVAATGFAGDGSGLTNLATPVVNWVETNGLNTVITMTKPLDSCTNSKPSIGCFVIMASASFSVSTSGNVDMGLQLYDGSTLVDSAYQTVTSSTGTAGLNGSVSLNWVVPVTVPGGTEVFKTSVYSSGGGTTTLNSHNLTVLFFPQGGH